MPEAARPQADVRPVTLDDAEQICALYNHYVMTSTITFEEEPVTLAEMASRIRDAQSASLPWLVAASGGEILGYAYASKWKGRAAYKFSVEVTIYVRQGLGHCGIGAQLYGHLLPALKSRGVHAVIGGVALPNDASLRFHQKFGFEKVAHFKEVGYKFNRWIDVTYWQVTL
jgi:phosphinothricin acetyltransferase